MKNRELKEELKFVDQLVQILKKNNLTSIEVNKSFNEFDNIDIKINNSKVSQPQKTLNPIEDPEIVENPRIETVRSKQKSDGAGSLITSPMVGTVYLAPSPEEKNFVEVGQTIKKGDTLLIIEAMKTMNPIPSTFEGKVLEIR